MIFKFHFCTRVSFCRNKNESCMKSKIQIIMAPNKYKNFTNFLKPNEKLQILSTPESLKQSKQFSFRCLDCNEISTFAQASFANKMCVLKPNEFCAVCFRGKKDEHKFNKVKKDFFEKTGHILLTCEFGGDRKCTYECGKCKNINSSHVTNLFKNTGVCIKCQNDKNKRDFNELQTEIEEMGFKMDMKCNEYIDNKSLQIVCKCGNSFKVALHDLKRGRLCVECKMDRCFDSGVSFRDYILPSGKLVKIQGFENKGIDYILSNYKHPITKNQITEDDIIVGKQIGYFKYMFQNKEHKYYPDIYIKDTNLYIEIKSTFTLDSKYDVNMAKFNAMVEHGKQLHVLVFDNKGLNKILEYQ